ncbi:hypothetical protein COV06_02090 [Candidatus Uhrbacteria bacterium CG10_big_fil_rev_8_21_14_0_10_50_16]|uniref:Aminoacyl-transfer RNA synthetases class-II family profile domain-containing protein n=1 Tax=Candidatus Uhrbacteria bacterium CG10_big_fil_rev_8_21_14_0_10_50_16 TaxID=1975039 RepID=A0A2H0RMJ3_9BACT|nr:MAG: hypothetical protein COV06_02090 [Candidatus Uhrbacteria bacterium CG10_big_fil_rev_8_21_14_0_10_50_16]
MNTKDKIILRDKVDKTVRAFFESRCYLEAQTPRFVPCPDIEPTLSHFESTLVTATGEMYKGAMITSPEYALKKIVSAEIPRIFEFARVFRNHEPLDKTHNHEFTMLEWYRLGATLAEGIEETIQLVDAMTFAITGGHTIKRDEKTISMKPEDWTIIDVEELFRRHCGMETLSQVTKQDYQAALDRLDMDWQPDDTISDLFQRLMLNRVDPVLRESSVPIIIQHYPSHESTLAQINAEGYAERFEAYIAGLELCNGYAELTDPVEQRRRFVEEQRERERLGKTLFPIDEALLEALKKIDQPLFGNGLGLDRLIMVLGGYTSIEQVLLFPGIQLFPPRND